VPFLDELASGIAPVSTPDIASFLGVSGGTAVAAMILAFHGLAFLTEAPLLAWSERVRPRWFSAAALMVVAVAAAGAAAFPRGWCLLLALSVYGPASGCALAVAEGLLVEGDPEARERTLARLSMAANAGDLAVPVLLALLSCFGLGWRVAFALSAALAAVLAAAHASARSLDCAPAPGVADAETEPAPGTLLALRMALARRPLLAWSLACSLTGLLDEVLVALSAVHLQSLGATAAGRSWAVAAWVGGGFVGLAFVERFVRPASVGRVLLGASAVTALAVLVLAVTRSPDVGTGALLVIGVAGSTLHPLTKAQSYAALPGRPALVNAVTSALLPLDMAAPVVLGVVATHAGSAWAIAGLLIAPAGVAIAAWRLPVRVDDHAGGET
jgi:hypothetical protein